MNRTQVPRWAQPTQQKITAKQREYILALLQERNLSHHGVEIEGRVDTLMKQLRISEDPEEFGMSKGQATEVINWLLRQPKKTGPGTTSTAGPKTKDLIDVGVPAGRYAVEANSGELRFYQVWQSRDGNAMRVYVCHGPEESALKSFATQIAVLKKIKEAGIREAAIRYGMEIGSCSNCGRRLTNRISRELGIGPICGGRMFGEDGWKDEVKTKRDEIILRGEDPEEEISDEEVA